MEAPPMRRYDVRVSVGEDGPVLIQYGEAFTLNALGLEIWKRCDGKTSVADISAAIAQIYAADSELIQADAEEFIGTLRTRGLVTPAPN
ncbi:PqqD family protein [Streptomyces sp. NPDC096057]|uniref:PqqD family protein n=1 Tax=Streptomyces sp. NPDC096057 TaxID=3155543 RepID=UPI00331BA4D3